MILVALLLALQSGNCFYCGVRFTGPPTSRKGRTRPDQWSRDHVLPLSKGGKLYVLACVRCNHSKGCRLPTPEEMRRAVILRQQVDECGRAYQGEGWTTLGQEKDAVHQQIETGRRKRSIYRYPKHMEPSLPIREALRECGYAG